MHLQMTFAFVRVCSCISWAERIHQALRVKEDGNARYRAGNYSGAISKYRTAMSRLQQLQQQTTTASASVSADNADDGDIAVTQPTDEELDSINSLLIDCHNNLAGITSHTDYSLKVKLFFLFPAM